MSKYDIFAAMSTAMSTATPAGYFARIEEQSRLQAAFCEAYEAHQANLDIMEKGRRGVLRRKTSGYARRAAWHALQNHINGETR